MIENIEIQFGYKCIEFKDRYKLIRRNYLSVSLPAAKCLCSDDLFSLDIDLGLIVNDEFLILKRRRESCLYPFNVITLGLHLLAVYNDALAFVAFSNVAGKHYLIHDVSVGFHQVRNRQSIYTCRNRDYYPLFAGNIISNRGT